ncbi:MAG: trehalose-phosphatase [candidate division Zixibacteria bacterium]|nr:trehalose-phosphatase [candidate division Zixibacteria bacterium]
MVNIAQTIPEEFWEKLRVAERRILMLDYDGTLAPFQEKRMEARPSDRTYEVLKRICLSPHNHVVIVSGRPATEVRELLKGIEVDIYGAHGFEFLQRDCELKSFELSDRDQKGLNKARKNADTSGLTDYLEVKPASLALHVRGLDYAKASAIKNLAREIFAPNARSFDLECREFDGGIELRSKEFHKGKVVESMLSENGSDSFVVYIGDDDTDEDAFETLKINGYGIRVGNADGKSIADWRLNDIDAVERFLERWLEIIEAA